MPSRGNIAPDVYAGRPSSGHNRYPHREHYGFIYPYVFMYLFVGKSAALLTKSLRTIRVYDNVYNLVAYEGFRLVDMRPVCDFIGSLLNYPAITVVFIVSVFGGVRSDVL